MDTKDYLLQHIADATARDADGIRLRITFHSEEIALGQFVQVAPAGQATWTKSPVPLLVFPSEVFAIESHQAPDEFVTENQVFMIDPRRELGVRSTNEAQPRGHWIWYAPSRLRDAHASIEDPSGRPEAPLGYLSGYVDGETFLRQRLLARLAEFEAPPSAGLIEKSAMRILHRVVASIEGNRRRGCRVPKSDRTQKAHREAVQDAKRFVQDNYHRSLKLDEVAASACMAPTYFCTVFRRYTGSTVHTFVMDLRLKEAFRRLPDYEGDLTRLSYELGFSSANHLSGAFSRHFGIPPSKVLEWIARPAGYLNGSR